MHCPRYSERKHVFGSKEAKDCGPQRLDASAGVLIQIDRDFLSGASREQGEN